MICWMCGSPADTGEHKIKKSLLVALHGKGAYVGAGAMAHVKDGEIRAVQGPDSALVKYKQCLCSYCNNDRSQPFDRAYDLFFKYVLEHDAEIVQRRVIDFADVYGVSFAAEQANLYKYFVKMFGCDLSHNGLPVPSDLTALLDKENSPTKLRITFAVNEDKLLMGGAQHCPIGFGGLRFYPATASPNDPRSYEWDSFFSFLHICYWYDRVPSYPLGSSWTANSRCVYLGRLQPLSPEQRREVEQKARTAPWLLA